MGSTTKSCHVTHTEQGEEERGHSTSCATKGREEDNHSSIPIATEETGSTSTVPHADDNPTTASTTAGVVGGDGKYLWGDDYDDQETDFDMEKLLLYFI